MGCIPSSNTLAALPEGLLNSFESYELFVGNSKAGARPPYFCTKCAYKNKKQNRNLCHASDSDVFSFRCVPHVFVAYLRKNIIFTSLALYPSSDSMTGNVQKSTKCFCLFWAICGILIQLLSWSSPTHARRTPIECRYVWIYTQTV